MSEPSTDDQTIEQLRDRYNDFRDRKIKHQTELSQAEKELGELKQQAREQFGSDDLEELQAKLKEMKAENESKRKSYQQQLDAIDRELQQIEADFAAAQQDEPRD